MVDWLAAGEALHPASFGPTPASGLGDNAKVREDEAVAGVEVFEHHQPQDNFAFGVHLVERKLDL